MTLTSRFKNFLIWFLFFVFLAIFQIQIFAVILGEPGPYLWLIFLLYFMFYRALPETLGVLLLVSFFLTTSSSLSIVRLIVSLFLIVMIGSEIQKKFFSRQDRHFFLACTILIPLWMGLYFGAEVFQILKLRAFVYTLIFIYPIHWMMRLCDRYDSQ